ncbi:hypothetical protein [Microbacterium candidum]|uniref:LPXTG cell wall anchor domain-containing protein n=1 Tax=Microbacterium candidum TaxID=3041922 RepID=A0ABT7N2P0_9MICO|nr:hypothetical protein [Microbacterium sp. ASV49]MDL9980982.1 hypothetical protein [Microbacterium sp. ASV49]
MATNPRPPAAARWWGLFAVVIASVLLAPVIGVGWCDDAVPGGTSSCGGYQRSIVGIETNVWIWLAAMLIVVLGTLVAIWVRWRRARR